MLNTINRNDKKAKAQTVPVSPVARHKQGAPKEADADDEDYNINMAKAAAKMAQKWDKHKQQREKEAAAKPKNMP